MPRPLRARPARAALAALAACGAALLLHPLAGGARPAAQTLASPPPAAAASPEKPAPLAITACVPFVRADSIAVAWGSAGLFDDAARRALESGVGAEIRFTVELWKRRRFWFNGLQASRTLRWLARLDKTGRRYVLLGDGGTLRGFESVRDLEAFLTYPSEAIMAPLVELSTDARYEISVRVEVSPLTLEAMQRIDYWIRGGEGGGEGSGLPGSGITRKLFGFVSDMSGFGDRAAAAHTPPFRLLELPASR